MNLFRKKVGLTRRGSGLSGTLCRVITERARLLGHDSSMAEALLVVGNGTNGSRG